MRTLSFHEAALEVKNSLDITEVVKRHVILKKSGSGWVGCCPFHKEKTPSFHVTPSLGIFKCFGCGEGGNAVSFLMKINNMSYAEVIKQEAYNLGIEIAEGRSDEGFAQKREAALEVLELAANYYHENLLNALEALPARDYLKNRGITAEIIEKYRLGCSLSDYEGLKRHLHDKSTEALEAAGLIVRRKNDLGYYDRFRGRLMIPVINETGKVVAFGARALKDGQNPKYLNSPDTILYNKSKILYGINTAKDAIRREDAALICEGYFDVISLQSAGVENAVASCGTALTEDHVKLLARYTPSRKIFLAFDTDAAGTKATERSAELIKEAFGGLGLIKQFDECYVSPGDDGYACEIRVVAPPEGKDPDEFIREKGAAAYREHLSKAPLLLDYRLSKYLKDPDMSPVGKMKLVKKILPLIEEIDNPLIQNEYVKKICDKLDVKEEILTNELRNVKLKTPVNSGNLNSNVTISSNLLEKTQKKLFSLFFKDVSVQKHAKLAEVIRAQNIENEQLNLLKESLDAIIEKVHGEESRDIFEIFENNSETGKLITDLIYVAETELKDVTEENFDEVVSSYAEKLKRIRKHREYREFKRRSKAVNDNETEAEQYQIMLREQIKRKAEN
ncbi:MAG: DNA primase [Candidatus Gastranaerophilaceae bacterium]